MDVDISRCRKTIFEQEVKRSSVIFKCLIVFKLFSPVFAYNDLDPKYLKKRIRSQRKPLCSRFKASCLREFIPEEIFILKKERKKKDRGYSLAFPLFRN